MIDDGAFWYAWGRLQEACVTILRCISKDDDSDHEDEVSDDNFTLQWGIGELQLSLRVEALDTFKDFYIYEVLKIHERLDKWITENLEGDTTILPRKKTWIQARGRFTVQHVRTLRQTMQALPRIARDEIPEGFKPEPSLVRLTSTPSVAGESFSTYRQSNRLISHASSSCQLSGPSSNHR